MADYVVKKDGIKEPFEPEKIRGSIREAARDAGLPSKVVQKLEKEVAQEIIEELEGKNIVPTREIRTLILEKLSKEAPSAAGAWRRYEARKS